VKTLFDETEFAALFTRVESLQPDSVRRWGTMDVSQMMAHVSRALQISLGKVTPPSECNFLLRWIVRPVAIGCIPMKRGLPTSTTMRMSEPKNFAMEKQGLLENLQVAKARGLNGKWHPHVAFGPLSAKQWGRLHRKHIDHHLRQFSA
jgi:hypothetical protein